MQSHSIIKAALEPLHEHCCSQLVAHSSKLPDLLSDEQLDKLIDELLKYIFKNRTIAGSPAKLRSYFADQLMRALNDGYGASLEHFDFDTPDYNMLDALAKDIVKFSGAKDAVMQKAIARELIGPDGMLREWKDFKTQAYQITSDHSDTWLKAEYNLAIASSQSASKWVQIEQDANDLPVLVFDAVIDKRTTELCRNFDGIRLPITDPFWDMYYVPNHWGERSLVKQDVDNGKFTDKATIIYPEEIPAIFRVNLAKNKMVFPPRHPYYKKN